MKREPLFINAGGLTIRVNPRTSPTSWICLQIMEPPEFNDAGVQIRDGRFTQVYVTKEQAKMLADILHAEAVLEIIE